VGYNDAPAFLEDCFALYELIRMRGENGGQAFTVLPARAQFLKDDDHLSELM